MFTFQQLIRIYSDNVAKGVSDTDLTPKERRLTQVMLNIASNAGLAVLNYPPQEDEREKIIKRFTDLMWDSSVSTLISAVSPSSEKAFSNAIQRTVEILRNM
jgi:hypothetical protein